MGPWELFFSFKPPLVGSEKVALTFPRKVEKKMNNALKLEETRNGRGEGRGGEGTVLSAVPRKGDGKARHHHNVQKGQALAYNPRTATD